ncbi:hypothetical protein J1N35_014123 [Gossypium stocksii]|uniref:Uncharacterized protein n=1 Tax=Gossypium stocksii TaxID=47602 RepID=A0A9D3VTP1_9ROSI|nr:hypothetical protein J1N35_014123 [Gossypium stocksii]
MDKKWMQEMSSVLQEIVLQNNMKESKYSLDIFSPTHSHHEAKEQRREEMEDSEDGEGEKEGYEMDFEEKDD